MRIKMEQKKKRVFFQTTKMKDKKFQMILANGATKQQLKKYNKVF